MAISALVVAGLLVVLLIGKSEASRIQEDVELWRESERALSRQLPKLVDHPAVAKQAEPDWNSEAHAEILATALGSREDSRPLRDTHGDDDTTYPQTRTEND